MKPNAAVNNIVRIGKVVEVDAKTCLCRVSFQDRADMVSDFIPVIMPFTSDNKLYFLPKVEDMVLCVFTAFNAGFILGQYYSENTRPKDNDENIISLHLEDGSSIKYDKKESKLNIDIKGDIELNIDKSIIINIKEDRELKAKNIKISAESKVEIESEQAVIKAKSKAEVEAQEVIVKGNKINLGEEAALGVVDERIVSFLNSHTHTGNMGNPTSPPVTPFLKDSFVGATVKVK